MSRHVRGTAWKSGIRCVMTHPVHVGKCFLRVAGLVKSAPARLAALDERLVITYLAVMAPRLLLTLLALLTGLAAQLTPAQARIRAEGASEIGAVAAIARSERAAIARPSAPVRHAQSRWREPRCSLTQLPRDIACAPAVMLRIDRARE